LRATLHALIDPFSTLLLPSHCRCCEQPLESLHSVPVCEACWSQVQPFAGLECAQCGLFLPSALSLHDTPLCGFCRRESFQFAQARSFGWYDGVLSDLIRRFKYDSWFPLARPLARCLRETAGRFAAPGEPAIRFDLILPVPLHRNRQRSRGYNQSQLLADELSALLKVPLAGKDCVRVRDTRPQTGLRGAERRKNVRGAFAVPRPERVRGASVLLIDDVLTTGATLDACAAALRQAGAGEVRALTLARARPGARDMI
jgi:competence protein ComFC